MPNTLDLEHAFSEERARYSLSERKLFYEVSDRFRVRGSKAQDPSVDLEGLLHFRS
jgi:hypothetical protein